MTVNPNWFLLNWLNLPEQSHILLIGESAQTLEEEFRASYSGCSICCIRDLQDLGEKDDSFDCIVCLDMAEVSLAELKELVSDIGTIIYGIPNSRGMQNFSGKALGSFTSRDDDEFGISKIQLDAMIAYAGFGDYRIYYPMNSATYPAAIYSDEFLPNEGDIRNQDTDLNPGGYRIFDEGIAYDKVISDGMFQYFAEYFLVVASKTDINQPVIFVKNNFSRGLAFQTQTLMFSENGKRRVEKYPLTNEAEGHIDAFDPNYEKIKDLYPAIEVLRATPVGEGVLYPYVKGTALDEYLHQQASSWRDFFAAVADKVTELYVVNSDAQCQFTITEEFKSVFGGVDCSGMSAMNPCNIDMILDNVILTEGGKYVLFDYEWVLNFPVPVKYVLYRLVCRLYDKYQADIAGKMSFEQVMDVFDFTSKEADMFRQMEDAFIQYVYATGTKDEVAKYARKSISDIRNDEKKMADQLQLISEYKAYHDEAEIYIAELEHMAKPMLLMKKTKKYISDYGFKTTLDKIALKISKKIHGGTDYRLQKKLLPMIEVSSAELKEQAACNFSIEPKISIITPLFNTADEFLIELFDSVVNQSYANWEFVVVNFSTDRFKEVEEISKRYAERDSRVSYHVATENLGIAENTNVCISYATGDYIGLLDHDDVLHPSALFEVVKAINETGADFVYTDEVKFSGNIKNVFLPNFKPDFTPSELRVHNFICHFNVYSRELFDTVGGYRAEYDGSQDHDIVLRLTQNAKCVYHIPKILYYWRVHEASVAMNISAKSYATTSGEDAVTMQARELGLDYRARSIRDNIPCYRFWLDASRLDDNVMDQITEIVYGQDGVELSINEITTPWICCIYEGLELHSDSMINELSLIANRKDIASIDMMANSDAGRIVSGGCYLTGDSVRPLEVRCSGKPLGYGGYEADMIHVRPVVAAAGFATLVNVELLKEIGGLSKVSQEEIIKYTYSAHEAGYVNLITPYITAEGISAEVQQSFNNILDDELVDVIKGSDPYFNTVVLDLDLD